MRRLRLCLAVFAAAIFFEKDIPGKLADLSQVSAAVSNAPKDRYRALEAWPPPLDQVYAIPRCLAPEAAASRPESGAPRYAVAALPGAECGWRSNGPALDSGEPFGIALGDSFTEGISVSNEETWTAQLSRLAGRRFLNLGVGAQGLSGHLERLRATAVLGLHPRVAVVQICGNDPLEDWWVRRARQARAGTVSWDIPPPPRPLLHALGPFVNYLYVLARTVRGTRERPPEQWEAFASNLGLIRQELEASDVKVLIVGEPASFAREVNRRFPGTNAVELELGSGRRFFYDRHWNARGHEDVARRVLLELTRRGWLGQSAKRRS